MISFFVQKMMPEWIKEALTSFWTMLLLLLHFMTPEWCTFKDVLLNCVWNLTFKSVKIGSKIRIVNSWNYVMNCSVIESLSSSADQSRLHTLSRNSSYFLSSVQTSSCYVTVSSGMAAASWGQVAQCMDWSAMPAAMQLKLLAVA